MAEKDFELIKKNQLNEEEKVKRADYIINTDKSLQETQQDNLLREVVETEYLFSREDLSTGDHKISRTMYGVPIGHRQEIEQYANEFVQALNEKYPEREGRVRSPPLLSHVDSGFPEHVELVLTLKSLPTNGLETNISLKDHGASYSSSNGSMESDHAPAIQIRAHASSGPLSLTENVVDVFEKIVKKSYLFNRVNSKTNYTSLTRE